MKQLPVGDILEWAGTALLVLAAYLWLGVPLGAAVAGVALVYFAQCYDRAKDPPERDGR